jgi:hypothetical protein
MSSIQDIRDKFGLNELLFESLVKNTQEVISLATERDYDRGSSFGVELGGELFCVNAVGAVQIDKRIEIKPKKKETARRRILDEAFAEAGKGKNVVISMPASQNFKGGRILISKLAL